MIFFTLRWVIILLKSYDSYLIPIILKNDFKIIAKLEHEDDKVIFLNQIFYASVEIFQIISFSPNLFEPILTFLIDFTYESNNLIKEKLSIILR